jgi:hypothetical protein
MKNGVSCMTRKSHIDFMLTFPTCLSTFSSHEKTKTSSA